MNAKIEAMTKLSEEQYLIQTIRAFLDGSGGEWDWDDFTSCSLTDYRLDRIRKLAGAVVLPLGQEGRVKLEWLVKRAEGIAQT